MMYLIDLEGKFPVVLKGEKNLEQFLEKEAQERKDRGCDNVDQWLNEMKMFHYSHLFTNYPEVIVILDCVKLMFD